MTSDPVVYIWLILSALAVPFAAALYLGMRRLEVERQASGVNGPLKLLLRHVLRGVRAMFVLLAWMLLVGYGALFSRPWTGSLLRGGLLLLALLFVLYLADAWRIYRRLGIAGPATLERQPIAWPRFRLSSLLLGIGATYYGAMLLLAHATNQPLHTLPLWARGVGLIAIGVAFLRDARGRK